MTALIDKRPLSLYIHIPFCHTRCGYCDFNTYAGMEDAIPAYLDALKAELHHFSRQLNAEYFINTLYFGGGTPSLIPVDEMGKVIYEVRRDFVVSDTVEISLEANPNSLSRPYLQALTAMGVNRISIGMQSAIAEELRLLDREHALADVQCAVRDARDAGIQNINLDLMFGIPHQSLGSLQASIEAAIALKPQHLSVYGLDLHEGTPLALKIQSGVVEAPDEDLAGEMYAWLMENLPAKGFAQYEISNWAAGKGFQCQHNLQYWRNLDYLGLGAGAHSYMGVKRWWNVDLIQEYIKNMMESKGEGFLLGAVAGQIALSPEDILKETMMMRLRLTWEGVSLPSLEKRFAADITIQYQKEIEKLSARGLIEIVELEGENHMRLTSRGRMLGNQVFLEFI